MSDSRGVVLDAGLFIAIERRNRVAVSLVDMFTRKKTLLVTSAGVVAQVWRAQRGQQVPVAFLLRQTEVVDLTCGVARVLGNMLGATRTSDPIDAHVALLARQRGWPVLTSDPEDMLAIDPTLMIERISLKLQSPTASHGNLTGCGFLLPLARSRSALRWRPAATLARVAAAQVRAPARAVAVGLVVRRSRASPSRF